MKTTPPSRLQSLGGFVFPKDDVAIKQSSLAAYLSLSVVAIVLVVASFQFEMERLKSTLSDTMLRLLPHASADPSVALIAYDDASSYRHDPSWHLPAEEIVDLLTYLEKNAMPKAVGILATLSERRYSDAELMAMAAVFRKVPVYVGFDDEAALGREPPELLGGVCEFLPGFVSRDTFRYGADGVSRRVMLTVDGVPTIYFKLAQLLNPPLTLENARAERLGDSLQAYIRWQGAAGTYPLHSSGEVLKGQLPPETFRDKIVLIGQSRHARKLVDFTFTPFAKSPFTMPTLEVAAQGLVTLARDNGFRKASWLFNFLLTLGFALLTVNGVLFFPPGRGIFWLVFEGAAIVVAAFISLHSFGFSFDLAHPLLVVGFAYYLVIPFRLVDEYKKRWHFQEKSELMAQLERLKSNFLSLITHDLKTPIARIQGNAELALSEQTDPAKKHLALTQILQTTDELSDYVETLVDLTRLEGGKLPLEIHTKDINATVLEVVDRKATHAAERGIQVRTELEPIFSFKYDDRLIRRVVANVVENAIQYSPRDSRVVIRSREESNRVLVSVIDEGFGIDPLELPRIFDKFYRGRGEVVQKTTGHGLGLYLARYFVELHEGALQVESAPGKGSTFTISLPVH